MIRHPELDSGSHNCINLLNSGKTMKLNIDIKKPWKDLLSNKKYVLELFYVVLIFVVVYILENSAHITKPSGIEYDFYFIYLALMINNIINCKEPVLENINIFKSNFFLFLKISFWGSVWITINTFVYLPFLAVFKYIFSLSIKACIISAFIALLPLFVFSCVSFLLFSEDLSFRDSFNFKKNILSFCFVWKEYLLSFILALLLFIFFIVVASIILVLFEKGICLVCSGTLEVTILKVISNNEGIIGNVTMIPVVYFLYHLLAQAYTHSLMKINETNRF